MLGQKIKDLRKEYNLTQKELAIKLGVSPATVGLYEQNRRTPDYDTLLNIANLFETTTDYLLGKSNKRIIENDSSEIVTKAFHLAEDVDELPQEALDQIDEYIRLLKLKHKK